jgi:hypothetical protein
MITYNPAFDLFHGIFRMAHIAAKLEEGESFEVDRMRIWDFYLLFPDKVHGITIRQDEEELRKYRSTYLKRENNPYDFKGENRKLFEWIKPIQESALKCLVSCGILDKEKFEAGRVCVADREALADFLAKTGDITLRERNVLAFMSALSRTMPMTGEYGLKARTKLLESKYDAE